MTTKNAKIGDLDWEVRGRPCPVIYVDRGKTLSRIYGEYDVENVTKDFCTTGLLFVGNPHYLAPDECFDSKASVWINRYANSTYRTY